ncbi:hypothetical protein SGLAD_v1c05610 [Spiroplasma gladiatoris]|uniref:Uncharacterized protein n=1 Tax=Spiroplasma gladiatoris TaxID=2143 RepID=A0A4P7AJP6_9MOLU|nr:hypothetical protein [Spiroplasma gladiatoris]QBQ07760.1 hypothetical protein SGLAD_v1c05610 [Spiroplasma gladiatoris]
MTNNQFNCKYKLYETYLSDTEINKLINQKKKHFSNFMIKEFPEVLIKCDKQKDWFCLSEKFLKNNKKDFLLSISLLERIGMLITEYEEEIEAIKNRKFLIKFNTKNKKFN